LQTPCLNYTCIVRFLEVRTQLSVFLHGAKSVNNGFRILGFCGDFHALRQDIMTFRVK
jgi:hypothetical protein